MNFILTFPEVLSKDFCEGLINAFKSDNSVHPSKIGSLDPKENKKVRKSKSLSLSQQKHLKHFDDFIYDILKKHANEYVNKFGPVSPNGLYKDVGNVVVKYSAGDFYTSHQDYFIGGNRCISAIFYLNNVQKGGETFFHNLEKTIIPNQGDLILFPAYFTHRHEALPVIEGDKYVVTNFLEIA